VRDLSEAHRGRRKPVRKMEAVVVANASVVLARNVGMALQVVLGAFFGWYRRYADVFHLFFK